MPSAQLAAINIIEVFLQSDIVGQVITVCLCISSLVTWTVMFGKRSEMKRMGDLNAAFEARLRDERSLLDLPESFRQRRVIPYGDLFADAVESYWRADAISRERGGQCVNAVGDADPRARIEHAENALQRALSRQTLRYESSMIFLASIVTGAPFLGLLGTVWGVMESFSSVSTQQTASIQALAPGISSALMTTVAGLLVAIPSLFGYNYILAHTKRLITELENFASSLADRIELESK